MSRVGGNAQTKAMKRVAGSLRLDLAAFRELEAFAQLGTELDKATQRQLDRGYRMVELLKQPQYQPRPVADQVIAIFAGTQGYFDKVAVKDVARVEKELIEYMKDEKSAIRDKIVETGRSRRRNDGRAAHRTGRFRSSSGTNPTHWPRRNKGSGRAAAVGQPALSRRRDIRRNGKSASDR